MMYFTCGPTQLYPTINDHIKYALTNDILSISHRDMQFMQIYERLENNLKQIFKLPSDFHVFFLSSSLEAMEKIIQNCVNKYSFHFVNGDFSKKFYTTALELQKIAKKIEVAPGHGFKNIAKIKIPRKVELICFTHNETSTGVETKFRDIYKIKKIYPDKLIAVDIVSSAPNPIIDFSKIDLAFFSVQKGFGLPSGLSILFANQKAIDESIYLQKNGINIGSHHNFPSLLQKSIKFQTPETPNVLNFYLLQKVTEDMMKKGIDRIRKETEQKSKIIYNYFYKHKQFKPFVINKDWQSKTTIAINTGNETKKIIKRLRKNKIIVSNGYGQFRNMQIRIANFPVHTLIGVKKLLNLI